VNANTYRFSSKEFLVNWNVYYYGYRYYHPGMQRWLNRDPLEDKGSIAVRHLKTKLSGDINLYRFVRHNPQSRIDPFGLDDELSKCQDRCLAFCSSPGIPNPNECQKNCEANCDKDPNSPPSPIPPTPPMRPKCPDPDLWPLIKEIFKNLWKIMK